MKYEFTVGEIYKESIRGFQYKVVRRTDKSIYLYDMTLGDTFRRKIKQYDDGEEYVTIKDDSINFEYLRSKNKTF